ncbi:MAG: AAA family ATPase [Actinomycetota bacterium]
MDGIGREAEEMLRQEGFFGGLTLIGAANVTPRAVAWAWEGRVPLGALSLLVGQPARNKSTLASELVARITRGQLDGALHDKPSECFIASAEDSREHTLVPRLIAAGADLSLIHFVTYSIDDLETGLLLPAHAEELEAKIEAERAALVVIDPVTAHLETAIDSHRDASIRTALAPLHHLAERTGAAVLGLAHLNKAASSDLFTKVGGSIGMSAAPRSIMLMGSDSEGEEGGPDRLLVNGKNNLGPAATTLRFRAETRAIEGPDGETIDTVGLAWLGEAPDVKASHVLAPAGEEERSALEEAVAFLSDLLAEGPVEAKTVLRDATSNGIAEKTLRRAKSTRGVVIRKEGGHFGKDRQRWVWSLPDPEDGQDGLKVANSRTGPSSGEDGHLQPERAVEGAERIMHERAVELVRRSFDADVVEVVDNEGE